MNTYELQVEAGNTRRPAGLVAAPLPARDEHPVQNAEVRRQGRAIPSELEHDVRTGRMILSFVAEPLDAGETAVYEVVLLDTGDPAPAAGRNAVHLTDHGDRVDIELGGELFTTYFYHSKLVRPCFHPIYAEGGLAVTRHWPMEEGVPGESNDHPHHRGLWVAHGEVNGVDNWSEQPGHGWTRHASFQRLSSGAIRGHMDARATWQSPDGADILEEARQVSAFELPGGIRVLDLSVHLTPVQGAVTFGDTKEGGICSLRVASSMDGQRGGRIEDADGRVGEAQAWGKRSSWCDYSGQVDGKTVGIAILDHPENFRHPTYWHVRDYGLMTANPFGAAVFTGDPNQNGSFTLPEGETLRFRYRVLVHPGTASDADLAGHYLNWTDPLVVLNSPGRQAG